MNPYPLAPLNHFTTPFSFTGTPSSFVASALARLLQFHYGCNKNQRHQKLPLPAFIGGLGQLTGLPGGRGGKHSNTSGTGLLNCDSIPGGRNSCTCYGRKRM
jgi:hypothetical protein